MTETAVGYIRTNASPVLVYATRTKYNPTTRQGTFQVLASYFGERVWLNVSRDLYRPIAC